MLDQLLGRFGKRRWRAAVIELCEAGLLTCTGGNPGDEEATYALGWFPLDKPEQFSPEVRARHEQNMRTLIDTGTHK
jgi:hypothetical protein